MTPTCSHKANEVYNISFFIVPCKHLPIDLHTCRFMATVNVLGLDIIRKQFILHQRNAAELKCVSHDLCTVLSSSQ